LAHAVTTRATGVHKPAMSRSPARAHDKFWTKHRDIGLSVVWQCIGVVEGATVRQRHSSATGVLAVAWRTVKSQECAEYGHSRYVFGRDLDNEEGVKVVRYSFDAEAALAKLPDDTIIDGEVVALDDKGKPSFNALQNYSSSKATLVYYVFDVMILAGRDLTQEKLTTRRELLAQKVLPRLSEPIRSLPDLPGTPTDLIEAVRREGLEGLVAKHSESAYEAGERSGRWSKMRINEGQEFVIGGYTIGSSAFDALIFGYYEGSRLLYAARTRNGFTPALRQALMKRFHGLETPECPFANLPEKKSGRWGQGLTAAKMKDCRWLKPKLVAQFEFVEWTPDNHLRHSRFVALREDKPARSLVRETAKGNE